MKRVVILSSALVTVFLFSVFLAEAAIITGKAYLGNQENTGGIEVVFARILPDSYCDVVRSNEAGEYRVEIPEGVYQITFSKEGYVPIKLKDVQVTGDANFPDYTLWTTHPLYRMLLVPETFSTIQAAIDMASPSDTILVSPGKYDENIDFKGKKIVVGSLYLTTGDASYISKTIIDGGKKGRVVTFCNGENELTVLTGFTITNGQAREYGGFSEYGGGILCCKSSPTLKNLCIVGNSATHGGGFCAWDNAEPRLEDVDIRCNTTEHGVGGGVFCCWSRPMFKNVRVMDNTSPHMGGGIYLERCSEIIFTNCIISGNSSRQGGGVASSTCSWWMINCDVVGNTAWGNGSGIYIGTGYPTIQNCIIAFNHGNYGVYTDRANPTICFSDLWENECGNVFNCNEQIGVLVRTNARGDWCDTFGNIFLNPGFCCLDTGDFALENCSPCIGSGLDTNAPETDIAGVHRKVTPDMGACENPAQNPNAGKIASVEENAGPASFRLGEAHPNPFNPSTTIEYNVPEQARVFLRVYNISGQKVATLEDGMVSAGLHSVVWDAKGMPSGVYFYRLTTEKGLNLTRKALLLK